ncbi:hypothetical protein AVEN_118967-1, partial [Araneus ventricosus]
ACFILIRPVAAEESPKESESFRPGKEARVMNAESGSLMHYLARPLASQPSPRANAITRYDIRYTPPSLAFHARPLIHSLAVRGRGAKCPCNISIFGICKNGAEYS